MTLLSSDKDVELSGERWLSLGVGFRNEYRMFLLALNIGFTQLEIVINS